MRDNQQRLSDTQSKLLAALNAQEQELSKLRNETVNNTGVRDNLQRLTESQNKLIAALNAQD